MYASTLIAIGLILSCALLGGYAGLFTSYNHGFLDALRICTSSITSRTLEEKCILNVPDVAHLPSYTSNAFINARLAVLFEFFAQGLTSQDGEHGYDVEAVLASSYLTAQFGGAWALFALEGLRRMNASSILSFTGTFGILFQVLTITVIAPIYLALHLLISPEVPSHDGVSVDVTDLSLLPASTTIAYILPTIGLALPLLGILSPQGKYLAISIWQPFPLYQTAVHTVLRFLCGGQGGRPGQVSSQKYKQSLGRTYTFILFLAMGLHVLVVGTIAISHWTNLLPPLSPYRILAPDSLETPPTLALFEPPVVAAASRAIVVSFLRWDVYCACAAFVIWAAYLANCTRKGPNVLGTLVKVAFWAVVGGPVTPAAMLLWERDVAVLETTKSQAAAKNK